VVGLNTVMKALSGPIGWVTLGVGALVTGAIALVKWFKRSSEEGERLKSETEGLANSTEELSDSIEDSSKAYKDNIKESKASTQANTELAEKVQDLAEKENKSASEKRLLTDYIEQLNSSVEGLNLSYNEEADALSMSSKELEGRIGLIGEQTSYNEALERQVEISKEQNEVDLQL